MSDIIQKLVSHLTYDPSNPLIFTGGAFLFLFFGFLIIYNLIKHKSNTRLFFVILFSLFFYYKTSGIYFLLLIGVSISDFFIGRGIALCNKKRNKLMLLWTSVAINIGLLVYFKYTNFLGEIFSGLLNYNFDFKDIFLPIGISFFVFQSLSYVIDIYREKITPLKRYQEYLFYISFFPQLVAGPIVRAKDFIPQIGQKPIVTRQMLGTGVFLIICGLFKKAVISDYISLNFVDRIFDNPLLYSGFENLMAVYGYSLQIYCDFSGYSDMAIGIALLLGFKFLPNFDSPYKSATITEFWRRWHISLSSWLKDYLYISLGGNRKGRCRTYINLFITMLLGGLWHGAATRFILWGALHGIALVIDKFRFEYFPKMKKSGAEMSTAGRIIGTLITFNFVSFSWIFFRANTLQTAWDVITQIFTSFHISIIWQFIDGYLWVIILISLGYILHFTSKKLETRATQAAINSNMFTKIIAVVAAIWLVMQMRSGTIQPFIYFQF